MHLIKLVTGAGHRKGIQSVHALNVNGKTQYFGTLWMSSLDHTRDSSSLSLSSGAPFGRVWSLW